tara:strand:+ start:2458 stop:3087 length:630 start_codon:yes stop_codon:yes gene_type:complete
MGTRKLYPIIFRNGQFGTSLSYFISQHKGFHHWTKEVDVYEGVMFKGFKGIAKWDISELSLDKFFEKFIEDIKKVTCKISTHHKLTQIDLGLIGTSVFPIIIKPSEELINININRGPVDWETKGPFNNCIAFPWEPANDLKRQEKTFNSNITYLKDNLKAKGTDYHVVSVIKLYRGDIDEYNKLLEFIGSPPLTDDTELKSLATFLGFK